MKEAEEGRARDSEGMNQGETTCCRGCAADNMNDPTMTMEISFTYSVVVVVGNLKFFILQSFNREKVNSEVRHVIEAKTP